MFVHRGGRVMQERPDPAKDTPVCIASGIGLSVLFSVMLLCNYAQEEQRTTTWGLATWGTG